MGWVEISVSWVALANLLAPLGVALAIAWSLELDARRQEARGE